MLNRLLRVIVALVAAIIFIPCLVLTPITYVFFNYSIIEANAVIFLNCLEGDWDYKTFLNYVK